MKVIAITQNNYDKKSQTDLKTNHTVTTPNKNVAFGSISQKFWDAYNSKPVQAVIEKATDKEKAKINGFLNVIDWNEKFELDIIKSSLEATKNSFKSNLTKIDNKLLMGDIVVLKPKSNSEKPILISTLDQWQNVQKLEAENLTDFNLFLSGDERNFFEKIANKMYDITELWNGLKEPKRKI